MAHRLAEERLRGGGKRVLFALHESQEGRAEKRERYEGRHWIARQPQHVSLAELTKQEGLSWLEGDLVKRGRCSQFLEGGLDHVVVPHAHTSDRHEDIGETQGTPVNFPMIGDADRTVSDLYDMIHPNANDTLTVRSVFIIGDDDKVKLILTSPASPGCTSPSSVCW